MITLTLEHAVAWYCGVWVVLFIGGWVVARTLRHRGTAPERIWQCSVCMIVFSAMPDEPVTECPRCGCYITKEGGGSGDH